MTKRRPLALGAAVTIGFGSLFFASPALAEETEITTKAELNAQAEVSDKKAEALPETDAPAEEAPVEEVKDLEEAGVEVVAIGVNAAGNTVLITTEASVETPVAEAAVEAFEAAQPNPVEHSTVATAPIPFAATDVVGGAGYVGLENDQNTITGACSIGFTAWTPEREPALLSAGHCTGDGTTPHTALTKPSTEPAVGGEGFESNGTGILGDFGFSQFGGPGNSAVTDPNTPDPAATDISVIENLGGSFTLHPEVTDWTTAGQDDLAASTIKIKSAGGDPVAGEISKAGRTTGFTTGTLDASNPDHIVDGYTIIEDRWVRGFSSNVEAAPGDSGGAVIQGDRALGVISGGIPDDPNTPENEQWTFAASLKHALPHIDGYEVALDIDAPVVESPANNATVQPGSDVVVSVPSNATELSVSTQPNSGESVPVENGQVVLTAPSEPGPVTYSLTAANGMSWSETVEHTIIVDEAAVPAPTINNVDTTNPDVTLTGTGVAGAEVEVSIDGQVVGTATVGQDGNWSVQIDDLQVGEYPVSATQTVDGRTSAAANGTIIVREPQAPAPAAPVITSITEGDSYAPENAPSTISGTGVDGATVTVTVGGKEYTATVANGKWTVDLGAPLAAGTYSAVAVQTVDGVTSAAFTVNFSVNAPATPPAPPAPGPGDNGNEGDLPETGSASLLPLGISAVLMLLAGGAVTLFMARRQKATEI